jgi:polar amino acid transport system permease protein
MNQSVIQLKTTSLVSTIAVPDLLYNGSLITAETYRPLEVYTVVALVYFVILFPATRGVQWYERRLQADATGMRLKQDIAPLAA